MGAAFGSQGCVVKTRPWLLQPTPADLRPAGGHLLAQVVEFAEFPLLNDYHRLRRWVSKGPKVCVCTRGCVRLLGS